MEPETISKLSELRIMENNLKSAMNKEKLEEPEKPENARGMVEDQWQDFSDSEEEMEALELLTRAEEALMLEYNVLKGGLARKTPEMKEAGRNPKSTGRKPSSKTKKTTPNNQEGQKKKNSPTPPPSKRMKTMVTQ